MQRFRFIDLFCGGGGSITGAINALNTAEMPYEGRGFNHWDIAIKTLRANHPEVVPDFEKACAPIESVLPDEIFADDPTRIDVVWASPSCTHHSIAAGGKPKSNQLRSQPEYLLPYLRLTKCRRMFVENVKELRDWGPLLDNDTTYQGRRYKAGTPDPRKKGLFFNLWYRELKASAKNNLSARLSGVRKKQPECAPLWRAQRKEKKMKNLLEALRECWLELLMVLAMPVLCYYVIAILIVAFPGW